jgi:hypothetical protein
MQQHKRQKRARESKYDDATDYLQNLCPIRSKWAGPCFPRMDSYERLQKRLRTSTGAMSCATFAKKLSILKGEVFFIDKDLLMGAAFAELGRNLEISQSLDNHLRDPRMVDAGGGSQMSNRNELGCRNKDGI